MGIGVEVGVGLVWESVWGDGSGVSLRFFSSGSGNREGRWLSTRRMGGRLLVKKQSIHHAGISSQKISIARKTPPSPIP